MVLLGAVRSPDTLRQSLAARVFSDAILSPSSVRFVFPHSAETSRPLLMLGWCIAKAGTQVIIPYRDEDDKRHLKVTGDLGQVVPMVRLTIAFEE